MAQLTDTIRLVELIAARLCHDLGGLMGTVGNAIDMMDDDAGRDGEVLAFAVSASKALTQRLRLMRAAWGPEGDALSLPALVTLAASPLAARRVDLDVNGLLPGCVFPPPINRLLLNLILLACDAMPRGGTIILLGEPADLLIRIKGPGVAWPAGLSSCLGDETAALQALKSARSLQMPLTALLALSRNFRLSPVIGPASGIEALRLTPADQLFFASGEGTDKK